MLILDLDSFQSNKSVIFRFKGCVFGIFVFNIKSDAFDGYQGPQSISMIIKCDVYLLKNVSIHHFILMLLLDIAVASAVHLPVILR